MMNIINIYKSQKHLYENGKNFSGDYNELHTYLGSLAHIIDTNNELMPVYMKNKDSFRRSQSKKIIDTIHKDLYTETHKKTSILKPYNEATPRDRLSYWGAVFNTLIEFFSSKNSACRMYKYISKEEYNKMPKRYRSAIKKRNAGYAIAQDRKDNNKISLILKNENDKDKVYSLLVEAKQLVSLIYKKELLGSQLNNYDEWVDENGRRWSKYSTEDIYGAKPSSHKFLKHLLITDEEIHAVKRLQEIFVKLAVYFWYIEPKTNAKDTIAEYNDAKKRENLVLEAQRYVRTVSQVVVSTKKHKNLFDNLDVSQAEMYYKQTKAKTMGNLYKTLKLRLK